MSTIKDAIGDLNLSEVFTVDTENPTIKNFIETVHKAVMQKAQDSKEKENAQNERSIRSNRILKLFCADIHLLPAKCARQLNEKYATI